MLIQPIQMLVVKIGGLAKHPSVQPVEIVGGRKFPVVMVTTVITGSVASASNDLAVDQAVLPASLREIFIPWKKT